MQVFLSHASADKPIVRELVAFLEAHNFQPWLDEKEIGINDNFPHTISNGLDNSQAVLVFHSANSAASRWVRDEWAAALDLNLPTALVKLDDAPMPALLRIRQHFDLRTNQPEGFRAIVTWLTGRERSIAQRFTAPSRAPLFVGRETELHLLRDRLNRPGEVLAITGDPGRGKTALALEFAWSYGRDFHAVPWVQCVNASTEAIAADLAYQLGFQLQGDPDKIYRQLRDHCGRQRYLLIFDNIDTQDLTPLLPGGQASVLITTRHKTLPFLGHRKPLALDLLPEPDCLALFQQVLEDQYEEQPARDLSRRLGHLAVAVSVAAGLVKTDLRHSLKSLCQTLPPLEKLAFGQDNVGRLLSEAIDSAGPAARQLVEAMAACSPSGFRLSLAAAVAQLSEEDALDAAQHLWQRSLIDVVDKPTHRYRLHTLVRIAAAPDDALKSRHAELVADQFKNWQQNWQLCEEDLGDLQEAFDWAITPWEQPAPRTSRSSRWDSVCRLANAGFRLTKVRGRWSESIRFCERMAAAAERAANRASLEVSLGNQALILKAWGRLEEAMALHKKEEAICLQLGDQAGLQRSYCNQALILQAWGRLEEAMALHRKEEAICLQLRHWAGLISSYCGQALILKAWGRLEEAMALHKKEEAICLQLGKQSDLQACYGNQALILKAWGRLEEAMALHEKNEAICLQLGDQAGLQGSYGNQAVILQAWGRLDEAMTLHKKQEAICLQLGDQADLSSCYCGQALILQAWGRLEEAIALHQKEEDICLQLGHWAGLARSWANQANIAHQTGDRARAIDLTRRALAIFEQHRMPAETKIARDNLTLFQSESASA